MATETRHQWRKWYKEEMDSVICDVLDQDNDSDIHKALEKHGCQSLIDIAMSSDGEINALDFLDEDGNIVELGIFNLAKVRLF